MRFIKINEQYFNLQYLVSYYRLKPRELIVKFLNEKPRLLIFDDYSYLEDVINDIYSKKPKHDIIPCDGLLRSEIYEGLI
jgi:hypothetical protein